MNLEIINPWLLGAAGVALTVIWWAYRKQDARITAAEKALYDFKDHCSNTYVTHNNFEKALQGLTDTFKAVFAKLDRIEDKLDKKLDRDVFYRDADKQ
jgi:hypothetical protein